MTETPVGSDVISSPFLEDLEFLSDFERDFFDDVVDERLITENRDGFCSCASSVANA